MLGIRRILVPVDFSDPSKKAVLYGLSLAVELDATLLLAHVVPFPAPSPYAYPFDSQVMAKSKAEEIEGKLQALVHEEFRGAVQTRTIVKVGDVNDELLAIARSESADLIVMGTHGRRRFERWLLGSVTERVLRQVSVPIMTVSHIDTEHQIEEPKPIPIHRLLYATDLSDAAGLGMETALALAAQFHASLVILHVIIGLQWAYGTEYVPLDIEAERAKVREGLGEQLEAAVPESARNDPRIRTELIEGVPYETILRVAEEEKTDLIVINTQSRSGLDRALLGSTAERVVRGARVPVLSVPLSVSD